ncbi:L-serine dehydratase [Marinobacterium lacunae]|uniref:L-serine dehydratase n=1 Tax=Marinobacterium lacunae TaxID=1232683 RepID=A0A081FT48_9GAMM|nr:L-serine ammonia-lyase [Marinobacterium lacunae]KEA61703.1 L-serine dehydratase [Marinobacterium lacunae]
MSLSMFDLFKIGIGPSSSHTVGPMVAARRFIDQLGEGGLLDQTARMRVQLYGSLAMTGKGHATDIAVILGLSGERPESVDPDAVQSIVDDIRTRGTITLEGGQEVAFDPEQDLRFNLGVSLPAHPNGLRFEALDEAGIQIAQLECYSVGGGFVLTADEVDNPPANNGPSEPWPFNYAEELMSLAEREGLTIAELMLANEEVRTPAEEVRPRLLQIWKVMDEAIHRGCSKTGELPGGLHVRRRAHELCRELMDKPKKAHVDDHLEVLDWVNLYALAVNEENAAGGRVVTAPTNGAAGVIPAVLAYYDRFVPGSNDEGVITFLATAAAIGMLYKRNASISAAEVGCQGEIGVACSMAAGALCAVLGGTVRQVENAAEIGMEHNLGLTCDPIAGLVQVPCIERNTMGAVKAINAARLALRGDGIHFVSLDSVIETMRQTGADMQDKYKETSTGGLAVNVVAC